MSNRPNIIGAKGFFAAPSELLVTNTICDAVDSAMSSTIIYPQAYTATVQDEKDERNIRSIASDVDLSASFRVAFGLFLTDEQPERGNILYHCKASLVMDIEANATIRAYAVFGQCDASTVTASEVAASNAMTVYKKLVEIGGANSYPGTSATTRIKLSIDTEEMKLGSVSSDPMCFAIVIENTNTTNAYNFDFLQCSMQFSKYIKDTPLYTPNAR